MDMIRRCCFLANCSRAQLASQSAHIEAGAAHRFRTGSDTYAGPLDALLEWAGDVRVHTSSLEELLYLLLLM